MLLLTGLCSSANAAGTSPGETSSAGQPTDASRFISRSERPESPTLLTNLVQLRRCAEQKPFDLHPFRIVADVLDADAAGGVLALHDSTGSEFIQLDLPGRKIEPGSTVCLEGQGCGVKLKGFGLAIVPGMVVDNDGHHAMTLASGRVFLHAGVNPITVQWFNGEGNFGLTVEFQGPGLTRRRIPSSALLRATIDPASGATNFSAGLNYRCYEGAWGNLPDFSKYPTVKTGVATNFDLDVRTQNENVGLAFSGFIRISRDGIYRFYTTSDDASRLCVGGSFLDVLTLSNSPVPKAMGKVPATPAEGAGRPWVTLEGTVKFAGFRGTGGELVVRVGNGDIRVEVFKDDDWALNVSPDTKIQISGIYQDVITEDGSSGMGMLLVLNCHSIRPAPVPENSLTTPSPGPETASQPVRAIAPGDNALPVVMTVAQVKAIPPELARQQLPVSVRGVVTAVLPSFLAGAALQDATKGISIFLQDIQESSPLKRGEFYQIDGVTGPGLFAPVIVARRITHLGSGKFPPPLHATWDQMMNGSLDTQYAEIEGVVTAVHGQQIWMLTDGGKIELGLTDFQSEELAKCEGAVVRIRGCIFADFNVQTHELVAGSLHVFGGALEVLQAAPANLFDAPRKSIGELLLYDPKTAPFRRLKVSGQVIYDRAGECFLTDGTNGLRVFDTSSNLFAVGDLVDAVGFLELGAPAAELKEAVMRQTGHASPPAPTMLQPDQLLLAGHAGTLVRVDATLMNRWREGSEQVLELQSGFLAFRGRINDQDQPITLPPSGSRLELTGVYAPQGNRVGDGTVSGFELLLHAPADIRVLATPPWWTLKRVLVVVGILATLLCAVSLWNRGLQRKVQERGRQLELESRSRRQAELQQAAEAERSRIARDLHDELGTGLTEVSLLASPGTDDSQGAENSGDRFRVIAEKARALVSGLDVIVWAIDPKRNSLQSFADYIGRYAEELFSASDILCRFDIPIECKVVALGEAARHSLFLAVKETLNNVIRHASATEVKLQMTQAGDKLEIVIADNGRGFDFGTVRCGNGLTNLHERLQALNGRCHIESQIGKGTTVKFTLPLT